MKAITRRLLCLILDHNWAGQDPNTCERCDKKAVGLPKFVNPPPCPPVKPNP